jgi:hypothetical protein
MAARLWGWLSKEVWNDWWTCMSDHGKAKSGSSITAVAAALCLFAAWTVATWFLEGRIETLLRPEARVDRALYAIIANLLIGIVAAIAILRFLIGRGWVAKQAAGFGSRTPSAVWLTMALVLGLALYVLQGTPSREPIVLLNAFSQVLVVSAAEVVVCWAVVGATVEALLRPRGRAISIVGAALVASVLFGAYHFAHSPPFNSPGMVAMLAGVGLVTSAFFFMTRDVYATILFHNFLAVFGVVQALVASGQLSVFAVLRPPLLVMAGATIVVLALSDRTLLGKRTVAEDTASD